MTAESKPQSAPERSEKMQRALSALKRARAKLEAIEKAKNEPLAIIGIGCRMPGGASSPERYWQLFEQGRDGIVPVPDNRWDVEEFFSSDPDESQKMNFREAGFIDDVASFDAHFFGISPREARRLDPQQRLLLQVAWEAIEDAGVTRARLSGSQTGVFLGINSNDYLQLQAASPTDIDVYTIVGGANSIAANRLSYAFDLQGPSMAIDTACSSSLVALHLACQSLRTGESDMALAAGVNLILSPFTTMAHTRGLPMAANSRCKTFDARADGYIRGEGCGVILLERLSTALANRDPILALVRGTAVNQDGRTNGLTAPNGLSQQAVIQRALAGCGIEPKQISLVESHGTGTALGDPIEVEALVEIYGQDREDNARCALGAAKTNIGHLEAAAGIAGAIKLVVALSNQQIPGNLHFEKLNPHLPRLEPHFYVPTETRPWVAIDDIRAGAVSAFGAGGTNAHAIISEAPPVDPPSISDSQDGARSEPIQRSHLLVLSARHDSALSTLAERYRDWLRDDTADDSERPSLEDITFTASRRRTHHEHRLAVVGANRAELADKLAGFVSGELMAGTVAGVATRSKSRIVFVFPGQGSQWLGMGRQLMEQEPAFQASMERCQEAIREFVDWSLMDEIRSSEEASRLGEIDVIQPTLWAIEVSLASLWKSWGITPRAVIGHSMGETAAAAVAGALSLNDAARIICLRSQLLRQVSGKGAMAVVGLPFDKAQALLDGYEDRVSLAVVNSPLSSVLSGDAQALQELSATLTERNVFYRGVKVDVASHSPQMDPLREPLLKALHGLSPRKAKIPIYSTVRGEAITGEEMLPGYWVDNLRAPVRFSTGVERLVSDGHDVFIEMSPHPILVSSVEQNFDHLDASAHALPSLRRHEPEREVMLESVGRLHTLGHDISWKRVVPKRGRCVRLPRYPWQERSYWFTREKPHHVNSDAHSSAKGVEERQNRESERDRLASDAAEAADTTVDKAVHGALLHELQQLRPEQRMERLMEHINATVAAILGFEEALDTDVGFFQMGMDSIMAVQVRRTLERDLELKIPATVVFEYPTIGSLSQYLGDEMLGWSDTTSMTQQGDADPESDDWDAAMEEAQDLSEDELLALLASELGDAQ